MLTAIGISDEARHNGMASVAAASLAEHIRLNPVALDHYLSPPDNISRMCTAGAQCTPAQQADYDFKLWQLELGDRIQNASGVVCYDTTPKDGVKGNDKCDGAGLLVIKIFWIGPSVEADEVSGQHRFTLEVS
jgi:hypothetical protein